MALRQVAPNLMYTLCTSFMEPMELNFLFKHVKITYACSFLAKNEIPVQEEEKHEEPHDYKEMDEFECDDGSQMDGLSPTMSYSHVIIAHITLFAFMLQLT